jgi:hypothetical protein
MGRFICHNSTCSSAGWASKRIAITIRLYQGKKYNARVYHQRCRSCNALSRPILDGSYAERVVYRIRKWEGVQVERPVWEGRKGKPHDTELCEGCRAGRCSGFGELGEEWV